MSGSSTELSSPYKEKDYNPYLQNYPISLSINSLHKLEDALVDQMLQKAIDLVCELDELGKSYELDEVD